MLNIHYIKRADLDVAKWNACIDAAANGLVYAYSFYLDAMCDNWNALVLNDYDAVMPLPWRKKWGIRYVYMPSFIQQLGVFSMLDTEPLTPYILKKAERHFSFGEYFINHKNAWQPVTRTNFILDLNKDYKEISQCYKQDLKNNLKKAETHSLEYTATNHYQKAIKLYQQLYAAKMKGTPTQSFERFLKLCKMLWDKNFICVREVTNQQKELLAMALCVKDKKRIYLLASSTTDEGRKCKATHFLLDRLIREFAGTPYLLDFEGSDLPGVYHFYQNFGSSNQPYFFYRWNRLPWPLWLLKK